MNTIKKAKEKQKGSRKHSRNNGENLFNSQKFRNYSFAKHSEVKIKFNKKCEEYMNFKYKDGLTFDNITMYSNDKLIKKINNISYCGNDFYKLLCEYKVLIMEIDEVIGKGNDDVDVDNVVDVDDNVVNVVNVVKMENNKIVMKDDNVNRIIEIKKVSNNVNKSIEISFEKSFASHPKSKYWAKRNEKLASECAMFSGKKAWFLCDCGHYFESAIANVAKGSWCPYCGVHPIKLCDEKNCNHCFKLSFAAHKLMVYWSAKNEKTARQTFKNSKSKYWFNCKCGTEFNAILYDVGAGKSWCPCCSQRALCDKDECNRCFKKSFLSNPKSIFWSDKNDILPRQVTQMSGKKFWFKCSCDCEFNTQLSYVTGNKSWCPCCGETTLCDNNNCNTCYKKSFASHSRSEFWSKNNDSSARAYSMFSGKQAYFSCICGHEFQSTISNISAGETWCPYCGIQPKKLCDDNTCDSCFKLSFASHYRSVQWSSQNEKTPRQVFSGTQDKYKFDCEICFHTFETNLSHIKTRDGWCNYCANKILCDSETCKICYEKSFLSAKQSSCWDNEQNKLVPRQVFKSSSNKYWFKCGDCKHTFNMPLDYISLQNGWCPYCCHKKLCGSDTCKMCCENSFINNPMVKYFSPKNMKHPRMIFKFSADKYIFDCSFCNNEYVTTAANVSIGHWCDCTINKTETKLHEYLKIKYNNIAIEKQKKFDWCKNINYLPFDFVLEQYKIIVELDGAQHFEQISNWKTPEETQKVDKYKMEQARKNGYSIIRILQTDVWFDKNNWKENLHGAIMEASQNIGNTIIIYIGEIYKSHYFIL